ncbi:flagellar export chaperone FliS [Ramlibacter sp. H39-3-26]|uniref:flagellar export chaperone FliS n=1 Tax=Curvibacter soli TaxID=3031331 RepID=UPI0023DC64C4|nr:flagellar export chaperone FliS [Ramlibacter sp. H39-3-26]MDF1485776.1 flagellar export chaperone FliS [Ramlibacter sp. H39-3-26]
MYTPVSARAASTYRQVGVESSIDGATPHQLVSLLFDGLMQSLAEARGALARDDIAAKGRHIGRAVRILEEGLKGGLNDAQGGAVADNLRSLYDYCTVRLTYANLRNDDAGLAEVVELLAPVAQSWKQIGDTAGNATQGGI